MSMLSTGLAWLAGAQLQHLSVSVVYSRDRTHQVTINAVPGRPDDQSLAPGTGGRVNLDDERLDFHVNPTDLDFGAGPVPPRRGDRIAVNGVIREVAPSDGQTAWSRSDVATNLIRVRTRLEGAA